MSDKKFWPIAVYIFITTWLSFPGWMLYYSVLNNGVCTTITGVYALSLCISLMCAFKLWSSILSISVD